MAREMFSARLDAEDVRWIRGYAVQRGTNAGAVLRAAVKEFRALATGGVPDVEIEAPPADRRTTRKPTAKEAARSAAAQGRVRSSGGPSSPGSAPPVVSRPAAGGAPALALSREELLRRRQANLEKQRGRR